MILIRNSIKFENQFNNFSFKNITFYIIIIQSFILPIKVEFNAGQVYVDYGFSMRLKTALMLFVLANLLWCVGIFGVLNVARLILVLWSGLVVA